MKYSISSRNTKPWSRTTLKGRSRIYGQIIAEKFTSEEFKELCRDPGINRELRTPHNPQ